MDEAENQINDLEHKEAKNHQSEQEKRIQKKEDSINSLWDNFKRSNICIIGMTGEEKEQDTGNLFGNYNERKLLNLVKEIGIQVQEAQRVPNKMD